MMVSGVIIHRGLCHKGVTCHTIQAGLHLTHMTRVSRQPTRIQYLASMIVEGRDNRLDPDKVTEPRDMGNLLLFREIPQEILAMARLIQREDMAIPATAPIRLPMRPCSRVRTREEGAAARSYRVVPAVHPVGRVLLRGWDPIRVPREVPNQVRPTRLAHPIRRVAERRGWGIPDRGVLMTGHRVRQNPGMAPSGEPSL